MHKQETRTVTVTYCDHCDGEIKFGASYMTLKLPEGKELHGCDKWDVAEQATCDQLLRRKLAQEHRANDNAHAVV